MALPLNKRIAQQQEVSAIEIKNPSGLSLYLDPKNRASSTFQVLENFDLVIPGSIRKVQPPVLLNVLGPFPAVTLNMAYYRAQINSAVNDIAKTLAITDQGAVIDVQNTTSYTWGNVGPLLVPVNRVTSMPWLGQMQGFYIPFNVRGWYGDTLYQQYDAVYKYSAADGNLYVYYANNIGVSLITEPIWPPSGSVMDGSIEWINAGILTSDRFRLNYLIVVVPGQQPLKIVEWQYDPTSTTEPFKTTAMQIGVTAPTVPINVGIATITPNLNGLVLSAGRAFVYTYYNPQTLHESSPSPFTGHTNVSKVDAGNTIGSVYGSVLQPLVQQTSNAANATFSSYQSYFLDIPVAALSPPIGTNYTHLRFYATHDGGTTFALMQNLYDENGVLLSNSDGGVPIDILIGLQTENGWMDYVPLPTPQNIQAVVRVFDGSGAINLAPDPENLGPDAWVETEGSLISVVPGDSPKGNAAFEYVGPSGGGPPPSQQVYKSTSIPVIAGQQYTLQVYIANPGTGGNVTAQIVNPSVTVVYLTLTQADMTNGVLSGTFTKPADGNGVVQIRIRIAGTHVPEADVVQWADFVFEQGAGISTVPTNYPVPDASLVIPAPAAGSQQPPPVSAAAEIYQNVLFLLDFNDRTRVWNSNVGDVNSYGQNAYFQFPEHGGTPILELANAYDRLLVGKERALSQIIGDGVQNPFERLPIDPQHGVLAYRASAALGSSDLVLMEDGLAMVGLSLRIQQNIVNSGFRPEQVLSDDIYPYLQSINGLTLNSQSLRQLSIPSPAVDNTQNNYLLALQIGVAHFNNQILMMTLRSGERASPFSVFKTALQYTTIRELPVTSNAGQYGMLALGAEKNLYLLFAGPQDGTLTATAVTQPLPTLADIPGELWNTTKIFRSLWVEGTDLQNFVFFCSRDGGQTFPNGPFTIAPNQNTIRLGITARQLVIKITHSAATTLTPTISYMRLDYDVNPGKAI